MAKKAKTRMRALPSETTSLTPHKAGMMLEEGETRGHKLTKKQKGFLGAVRGKKK